MSAPEQTFGEEFEVLATVAGDSAQSYSFVSDLRDEGVSVTEASDAWLQQRIVLASRYIERATGRFFEPRTLTFKVDGTGKWTLLLRRADHRHRPGVP